MAEDTGVMRTELLAVVGAVGTLRDQARNFDGADLRYLERELDAIQSAAHRLFEFLDNIEQRN